MKTLKQFATILVLSCCFIVANAQCGVNGGWRYTINPNNVHVFTDTSSTTGNFQITNRYWSFGDGSTSNLPNPTHQYANPGIYTVCEYVLGSNGVNNCIDTVCQQVSNCNGMVQAAISANVQGSTVVYTGTGSSNYPPLRYSWTFAGGTPSTSNTSVTTVIYNTPGVHQACLTVRDTNGCSATVCRDDTTAVTACGNLVANFNASINNGFVYLSSNSTGTTNNTLYQWWRDGQAITNPTPNTASYQYAPAGIHTYCLYVYSAQNFFCDSACRSYTIDTCNANFQTSINNNVVTFTPQRSGPASDSYWNFGDGVGLVDTSSSLIHTYPSTPNATTYTVCHVWSKGNCADTVCKQITIPGTTTCGNASFTSSQTSGHLVLTSTSTGTNTNVVWAIRNPNGVGVLTGSGTPFTASTLPNGTYQVCLYLYNNNQQLCDTTCQTIAVTNSNPCNGLSAQWTQVYNRNDSIAFAASNTISGVTYNWSFGDGQSASTADPIHRYPGPGSYTVCLVVAIPGTTCKDTVCRTVQIACHSAAIINATNNGNGSKTLSAAGTGIGASLSYAWSDGETIQAITVTAPGQYCVTVSGIGNNCSATACYTFATNLCDTALFTTTQTGNTVVFTSTSSGSNTRLWTIRDNNGVEQTGTGTPFTATLAAGTYQVCLSTYNNAQQLCDSNCRNITVTGVNRCDSLTAQWSVIYNQNDTVKFQSYNPLSGVAYRWTFGDGTSAINVHPTHRYSASGTYNVCLITTLTGTNCADTVCQTIQVGCGGVATISTVNNGNGSKTLTAAATGLGTSLTYAWSIGATTQAITVTAPGQYCVTVTNSLNNCSATACYTFAATTCDTASFTVSQTLGTVVFTSTSSGTNTRLWTIRNSNGVPVQTGSGTPFTATLATGAYQVCLFVYNNNQQLCDSNCQNITVNTTPPTCLTLQPNDTAGKDALIASIDPTTNYGNHVNFYSAVWTNSGVYVEDRSLLQFNLSGIPAGSTIVSARLSLYCDTTTLAGYLGQPTYGNNNASYLKLVTSPWAENTVTWNTAPSTTTTNQVLLAQSTSVRQDYLNINVAAFAQQWVNTPSQNYGMLLDMITTSTYNLMAFCSSDHPNATKRPKLEICYIPCSATANITPILNSGSARLEVTATGLTPTAYLWSNGATTASITVTTGGNYCVTVTGTGSCSATACYNYAPAPCGTASFTATQTGGRVVLTSTSTGTNNQYVWAIRSQNGTGVATGSGSPFTSPVLANGVYQVCLYLYNSNQQLCDTTCQYVTVNTSNPCLGVSAQWTKTYNTNNSISFSASNQVSGNQYLWTFGDGSSATTADPVHGYTTAGLYNVCLMVWRSGTNCSDTVCQNLQANPATTTCTAVASFTTTIVNGSIHATSTSTNLNSNPHYYWNVYGSNNNLIQSQSGTSTLFESQVLPAGTYQVCLFLFGSNTQTLCDSACATVTITSANPCAGLNADYTYAYLTSGGVQFYPVTNAGSTTHYWNFGDGTTSTNADPIHYYTTAGRYTICHSVEIPGSGCFDSTCTTIQVTAGNPCSGFTVHANLTSGWLTTRHLEAVTAGGTAPFTYLWSNGATGASIYPTTTGNYCVTVYDARQCSATDCETFTSNTPPCNASYSYTRTNCNTIQFTNASTGGYTNVVWNFGDGTSSSAINPTHSFGVGTWTVQLTVYSNGTNCQASYYQVITIQPCGINDTICGVVFNDINGNGVQESNEPGIGGGIIYAGNYHETVSSNGHYTIVLPAGNYTLYYCAAPGYSFTIPVGTQTPNSNVSTCAYYTITTSGGSHCGYNFGVQNNSSTVCGTVYFDANNNHVQDAGETGQANSHVTITGSNGTVVHSYTDPTGHYCVTLFAGTYTLTVQTLAGYTLTPQAITLTTVAGTNYYNNNFGVYTPPGSCDLRLDILPHTTVTAGFAAWYELVITNLGASTSDGTMNMFFDPALTFTSAAPAQTTANNSTQTISWDFTGLTPGSNRHFMVNFRALTNIQINQPVFTLANVTTSNCNEVNFDNNVDTVHQNVTASWDPNNKLVLPDGVIKGDERLTYTVNFQNTGNAPAVNIVVRDTIAPELDIETFEMVDASHAYTVQLAGREVVWKLNAIMLPDSNTNEPQSHGHVSFSILPKANLDKGTQLTNRADIYFDYNAPVGTNSTLNTIDYELSVADLENGKVAITLMPNPFKEFTTIKIDGENTAYELKMFDMLGQQVHQDRTTNNLFSIQRQTLAAGVYMYQITKQGKVIDQGKMIAE